jgi:hypothetical protein
VVHGVDPDDPGAVLGLLVDPPLATSVSSGDRVSQ